MSGAPLASHELRSMPAICLMPFVKGQRDDHADTEGVAETIAEKTSHRRARPIIDLLVPSLWR